MEPVRQAQRKYGARAMVVAVAAGAAFILLGYKPVGKGLILGTLFSVLNFVLMAQMLPLRVAPAGRRRSLLVLAGAIIRYALLAVPLVLAIGRDQLNLAATIGGVFMIQLVILAEQLYGTVKSHGKQPGWG